MAYFYVITKNRAFPPFIRLSEASFVSVLRHHLPAKAFQAQAMNNTIVENKLCEQKNQACL